MFELERSFSLSLSFSSEFAEGSGSLSLPAARAVTVAKSSSSGVGDLTLPLAERRLCSSEDRSRLNVFGGGWAAESGSGEVDVDGWGGGCGERDRFCDGEGLEERREENMCTGLLTDGLSLEVATAAAMCDWACREREMWPTEDESENSTRS